MAKVLPREKNYWNNNVLILPGEDFTEKVRHYAWLKRDLLLDYIKEASVDENADSSNKYINTTKHTIRAYKDASGNLQLFVQ